MRSQYYQRRRQGCSSHCSEETGKKGQEMGNRPSLEHREEKVELKKEQRSCQSAHTRENGKPYRTMEKPPAPKGENVQHFFSKGVPGSRADQRGMGTVRPCKEEQPFAREKASGPQLQMPGFLQKLFPHSSPGDLLALLILLLLISEGREDAKDTILTLLIFLLL